MSQARTTRSSSHSTTAPTSKAVKPLPVGNTSNLQGQATASGSATNSTSPRRTSVSDLQQNVTLSVNEAEATGQVAFNIENNTGSVTFNGENNMVAQSGMGSTGGSLHGDEAIPDLGLNHDSLSLSVLEEEDLDDIMDLAGQNQEDITSLVEADPVNHSVVSASIPGEVTSMGCEEILNDFIQENYGTKPPEDHLAPPVAALLASTVDGWCLNPPTKETIKNAFEQCKVPSNIVALGQIKINDIIYQRLPVKTRENDRIARNNASYYIRAMGPLAYIWNVLIKAEAWALKTKSHRPAIKTQEETIPLRDLIACISASMKLLSLNVSLHLHRRKSALKPHLDPKFHTLAGPSNKITSWLFGDNLEQKVSDIFKIAQAARSHRFQAVRGRSRGHHRSFCPRRRFQERSNFRQQTQPYYNRRSRFPGSGSARRAFGGASGNRGGRTRFNKFRSNFRRNQGTTR